jgi:hypothetical protein
VDMNMKMKFVHVPRASLVSSLYKESRVLCRDMNKPVFIEIQMLPLRSSF